MRNAFTLFDAYRDRQELKQLRLLAEQINESLEPLTATKTNVTPVEYWRMMKEGLDLTYGHEFVDPMRFERVQTLATQLTEELEENALANEKNLVPALAMRILCGWLRCQVVARRSRHQGIIFDARELENLYLYYMKAFQEYANLQSNFTSVE
jgi:hypothetical protein